MDIFDLIKDPPLTNIICQTIMKLSKSFLAVNLLSILKVVS